MARPESKTELLQKVDTGLLADSTEWCPLPHMHDILLCGTYQLQEDADKVTAKTYEAKSGVQVRKGQLQVYQLVDDGSKPQLCLLHTVDMPGILDIKWCSCKMESCAMFGLCNALGKMELWSVGNPDEEAVSFPSIISEQGLNPDSIALALDWTKDAEGSGKQNVVASDTMGALSLFEIHKDVRLTQQWTAHELEAWTCAFNYDQPAVIYSGGDDCKFKCWDLRSGTGKPVFVNRKDMGVCSIQNNKNRSNFVAVGSYDESVDVFDTRQMKQAVRTGTVGGGVWRVKWEPHTGNQLLTASMHNGFHILDCFQADLNVLPVLHHYTEHASLGYGADWCHCSPEKMVENPGKKHENIIATCSFYDHMLQLWRCSVT